MLHRICTVQIQPRNHVLDHAGYTAPNRQHEWATTAIDHTHQKCVCPKGESMVCPRCRLNTLFVLDYPALNLLLPSVTTPLAACPTPSLCS